MLTDAPDIDTLIIPIGGGGLISGCATVARDMNPGIEIIGVQAELYPSMKAAVAGEPIVADGDTLAEGIAVKFPGSLTVPVVKALKGVKLPKGAKPADWASLDGATAPSDAASAPGRSAPDRRRGRSAGQWRAPSRRGRR